MHGLYFSKGGGGRWVHMCISGVSCVVQWENITYVLPYGLFLFGCSGIVESGLVYVKTSAGLCSGPRLQTRDGDLVG